MTQSDLEATMDLHLRLAGITDYEWEYRFIAAKFRADDFRPGTFRRWLDENGWRDWRFDFAWPKRKIALEVEGGTWSRGRHTRGSGFEKDCEKYNEATLLGWRVMRVTGNMVKDGRALQVIERALKREEER